MNYAQKDDFYKKLRTRKLQLPGGHPELVTMEQWYWTTLDWLTTNFTYTEEAIIRLGLKHQKSHDISEIIKMGVWVLYDSHQKKFHPDEYVDPFPDQDMDEKTYRRALQILGVRNGYTLEELHDQYITRFAKIHPDLIAEFNEAYEKLKKRCVVNT